MPSKYLHELKEFPDLLNILATEKNIEAALIEKDYWIMHVLYGMKRQGLSFEMKGGTSLSKGYGIIERFSEDIDIQINPPAELGVVSDPKNKSKDAVQSRKDYYDWLRDNIQIPGIVAVTRDTEFDTPATYNSGGIRLHYENLTDKVEGLKEGILLEAGFDTVTPNEPLKISSWAFDRAAATKGVSIEDNQAVDIACYHPGYTFVEKLQTIVTKFRVEQEKKQEKANLMRQYYDVYSLLKNEQVQAFIGTEAYEQHKAARFTGKDKNAVIAENDAFYLPGELKDRFRERYEATRALYYNGQPPFDELLTGIQNHIGRL